MADEIALVFYGRGDSLGNFKFFADDLVVTELAGFDKKNIIIKNVERRKDFFDFLNTNPFPAKIKEFHIYSHAYGGALSLGYHDPVIGNSRALIADTKKGGKANYLSVLDNEVGSLFSDDFIRKPYSDFKPKLQGLFAKDAKIKIWGCNSGVEGWTYSDSLGSTYVYEPDAPADYYYWRALNELNVPKSSVAQAFANYFQVKTFGARSGSSIQVKYQGVWQSPASFMKKTKRKTVGEAEILRLSPDKGDYYEYVPK